MTVNIYRKGVGLLVLCGVLATAADKSISGLPALAVQGEELALVAKELGEVRKFMDNPAPNHTGTRFVYARTTQEGYAVYLQNFSTGKSTRIFQQDEKDYQPGGLRMLGWSPDDRQFAYLRCTINWEVVVVDGDSGAERGVVPVDSLERGGWVSDEAVVYQDSANVLNEIRQGTDGWLPSRKFKCFENERRALAGKIFGLAPYLRNTVAWLQGQTIWACAADQLEPTKVFAFPGQTPVNFVYSVAARAFLLQCRDDNGDYIARFRPDSGEFALLERVDMSDRAVVDDWIGNLALVNGGNGYAYRVRHESGKDTLVIRARPNADAVRIEWPNLIKAFAFNDASLYVTGSRASGPIAIWQYHAASGELAEAVENGAALLRAKLVAPVPFEITYPSGQKRICDLYPPADFVAGRKYPLVIGVPRIGYEQALANAGAFFACARRYVSEGSEKDDFPAIHEQLMRNESIDPSRVFLIGTSRGTRPIMDQLMDNSGFWAGAIILSPNYVPDFSGLRRPCRMLVDQGEVDTMMSGGRLGEMKMQVALARMQGISIEYAIRAGAGHFFRAHRAETERIQAIIRFLNQK